jgi:hypothetical protein
MGQATVPILSSPVCHDRNTSFWQWLSGKVVILTALERMDPYVPYTITLLQKDYERYLHCHSSFSLGSVCRSCHDLLSLGSHDCLEYKNVENCTTLERCLLSAL